MALFPHHSISSLATSIAGKHHDRGLQCPPRRNQVRQAPITVDSLSTSHSTEGSHLPQQIEWSCPPAGGSSMVEHHLA